MSEEAKTYFPRYVLGRKKNEKSLRNSKKEKNRIFFFALCVYKCMSWSHPTLHIVMAAQWERMAEGRWSSRNIRPSTQRKYRLLKRR